MKALAKIALPFAIALVLSSAPANSNVTDEWRFSVLLDGKPIGFHRFQLREQGAQRELLSEARFNVKILFVNAYRYAHDARELWTQDCLQSIDARTNDNGTARSVRGALKNAVFEVATKGGKTELTSCVQTFAYWNPRILDATHLLNPQTGEYVPVTVTHVGAELISVRGVQQMAEHYHLDGASPSGTLNIDLWYSPHKEWLALASRTADGKQLRYSIE